jgi:hypothetical protein
MLPVDEQGSVTAGMNFHLPRSALALPQRHAGAALLAERASELGLTMAALEAQLPHLPQLQHLSSRLHDIAARMPEFAHRDPE